MSKRKCKEINGNKKMVIKDSVAGKVIACVCTLADSYGDLLDDMYEMEMNNLGIFMRIRMDCKLDKKLAALMVEVSEKILAMKSTVRYVDTVGEDELEIKNLSGNLTKDKIDTLIKNFIHNVATIFDMATAEMDELDDDTFTEDYHEWLLSVFVQWLVITDMLKEN